MSYNLLAANVPAPQVVSNFLYASDYEVNSSVPNGVASKSFIAGSNAWTAICNRNGILGDIVAQYGAGIIGIIHGLLISTVTGANLPVTAGGALIEGVVQKKTSSTVNLPSNGTYYIWWKKNGTFEAVNGSITSPSPQGTYIGRSILSGGNVTAIDLSGVVYIYNGIPIRFTGDVAMPTDTPPSNWLGLTITNGGTYLWNGIKYLKLGGDQLVVDKTANYSITSQDKDTLFTNNGASGTVIFTVPAGTVGTRYKFYVKTAQTLEILFSGSDILQVAGSATSAGGNVSKNTVGNYIEIVCVATNLWIATATQGTWTLA